ncbi:MAG: penicillin acylase family protein, partial [Longimicrobiales bacterium]
MTALRPSRLAPTATLLATMLLAICGAPAEGQTSDLTQQVEIRRTKYGIPHIKAENLRAAGFGLGYVQVEDYGDRVIRGLIAARGELGRTFGPGEMESDFLSRLDHARAVEMYHLLDPGVRDILEGFAEGVNHYIRVHGDALPDWAKPVFTGHDVTARDVGSAGGAQRFLQRIRGNAGDVAADPGDAEEGSNAWALAPSRTRSGKAILLRNPHLAWDAGYYEAHVTVAGVLNFYGDFRIGGPFGIIGGFNEHLGWSTTNNAPDTDEVYALDVDPERPDHYLFDGASVPIRRVPVTIEFTNGQGLGLESRDVLRTPLGPVIHRGNGKIYVLRAAGDGEYRMGEQLLGMMKATSLEEWKAAMRVRARTTSNFTYADRRGNIFYVWNGSVPALPHGSGGDTAAVPARTSADVWTRLVPFDSLPMVLNPKGGYIHQENDSFHFTNMNEPLDAARYPVNFTQPSLRLRSQHAIGLLH